MQDDHPEAHPLEVRGEAGGGVKVPHRKPGVPPEGLDVLIDGRSIPAEEGPVIEHQHAIDKIHGRHPHGEVLGEGEGLFLGLDIKIQVGPRADVGEQYPSGKPEDSIGVLLVELDAMECRKCPPKLPHGGEDRFGGSPACLVGVIGTASLVGDGHPAAREADIAADGPQGRPRPPKTPSKRVLVVEHDDSETTWPQDPKGLVDGSL
jgi:hypothetical protein